MTNLLKYALPDFRRFVMMLVFGCHAVISTSVASSL